MPLPQLERFLDRLRLDEVFLEGTAPTELAPAQGEERSADKLLLDGD